MDTTRSGAKSLWAAAGEGSRCCTLPSSTQRYLTPWLPLAPSLPPTACWRMAPAASGKGRWQSLESPIVALLLDATIDNWSSCLSTTSTFNSLQPYPQKDHSPPQWPIWEVHKQERKGDFSLTVVPLVEHSYRSIAKPGVSTCGLVVAILVTSYHIVY